MPVTAAPKRGGRGGGNAFGTMSLTLSRLTAFLAALAMIGVAGTFWWAVRTRSEMKAVAAVSHQDPPPRKLSGRVGHDPRAADAGSKPGYELAGRSAPLHVDTAGVAPSAPSQGLASQGSPSPGPASQGSASQGSAGAASSGSASHGLRGLELPPPLVASLPGGSADMPLPTLLPPPAQPDPVPVAAKSIDPPAAPAAVAPVPPPAPDSVRRRARASVAPAPAPKRYYMEKYLELGEYHYRRRPCEPPNMPDVCFMPQNDREPIVVVSKP